MSHYATSALAPPARVERASRGSEPRILPLDDRGTVLVFSFATSTSKVVRYWRKQ